MDIQTDQAIARVGAVALASATLVALLLSCGAKIVRGNVVFFKAGLDPSITHTLGVRVLGAKNAASKNKRVAVDAFVVLRYRVVMNLPRHPLPQTRIPMDLGSAFSLGEP